MSNPIAWNLADLAAVPPNGIKVASTFACGGGSSMGYKLAGCEMVGANDIDPEMAWHYRENLHPRNYFLCPVRELLAREMPPEMFALDILDGSPPCSTFSTAGRREKDWGKKKHFREGQAEQVLSDLFFDFLDVAERLRPRAIIAENVSGMIKGNAKGYVRLVFERLRAIGYRPQLFLVNAADCGVPQRRERVFFCALRDDQKRPPLTLAPRARWVSADEACADLQTLTDDEIRETAPTKQLRELWPFLREGENLLKAHRRMGSTKISGFTRFRMRKGEVAFTLTGADAFFHWSHCRTLTLREWKRLGSFPDDYRAKTPQIGKYMIGMSVPPRMAEQVARAVCTQWLGARPDPSFADVRTERAP